MSGFRATLRILEVIDGNRAFVEWSVGVECPDAEREHCAALLEQAMPQWMNSLRAVLDGRTAKERA